MNQVSRIIIATLVSFAALFLSALWFVAVYEQGNPELQALIGVIAWTITYNSIKAKPAETKENEESPLVAHESTPRVYEETIVREKGKLVNGKREGEWDFFNENGEYIESKKLY